MIPEEERLQLPEDENSPQKRADKLWAYFKKGENGEGQRGREWGAKWAQNGGNGAQNGAQNGGNGA